MDITVLTPTKAIIKGASDVEIADITKKLSFTNTNVMHQIRRLHNLRWLRDKNPIEFKEREDELNKKLKVCLINKENGHYWVRPGSLAYLKIGPDKINISYPAGSPIPWNKEPDFEPYEYQIEAVENLINIKHGNISLPTGAGKSMILLMLAKRLGLKTVVVTPSRAIFNELLDTFQNALGKKYVGGYGDGKKDTKKLITIAISKSLTMLKPGSDAYNFFKEKEVLEVDESHTFAAETLEKVCHGILSEVPYRFFVSATQTRGDGTKKLLQSIIGKNVLSMDLETAINNGYLCPLKFIIMSATSDSRSRKKDPIECNREHYLYNANVADIYARYANANWHVNNESTLILVKELRQIAMLEKRLKVPFAYVHSTANKGELNKWGLKKVNIKEEVEKFNSGEVKVLIGTTCISVGTNLYPTHSTINWMGGTSEVATKQGPMGRSTRILSKSKYKHLHKDKPVSYIIDCKVTNNRILSSQLNKRIDFYKESGGKVVFAK